MWFQLVVFHVVFHLVLSLLKQGYDDTINPLSLFAFGGSAEVYDWPGLCISSQGYY